MAGAFTTIGAAVRLVTGLRVAPADVSDRPDTALNLFALALAISLIGGVAAALQVDLSVGTTGETILMAALSMACVALAASETMRILNGTLALALIVATVAWPATLFVRLHSVVGGSTATAVATLILLAIGFWRLLGQTSEPGRWRRAAAVTTAFVTLLVLSAWPSFYSALRAATVRRAAAVDTASDRAARAVAASFDGLDLTTPLIDQAFRFGAAMHALPPHPAGAETFVLAVGGNGFQAIFDREAHRAASVLTARTPGPALVLSNTAEQVRHGLLASPRTVDLAVAAIGHRYRPGDTLVVYLASHGGRDAAIAMDAPGLDFADLSSRRLAADLDHADVTRRIVIVSACFGASWIPALANPTTIVIAAARADRTSFGCDDSRLLTVFGGAITGELAHRGLPLAEVFARAKARVAAVERDEGDTPSQPQVSIGSAMTDVWDRPPATAVHSQ